MSIHLQPPVPLVTLIKTLPPTVIKNEPSEEVFSEALEDEISTDIKDIVYHPLSEDLIKSETVLEDILEYNYLESLETQALVVKTENSPFIKTENITQTYKSEDTNDGNVSRDTGQGVVEVQASNEHSNALSNLEIDKQYAVNFSKDLNSISVRSRKSTSPRKADFVEYYKTDDTTLWEKEKETIRVIKTPVIPVEAHEYTSLAKDRHVCNHCQYAHNRLDNLKLHIKRMHREVPPMYQCPYCSHKSKWAVQEHIIRKHKDPRDIQWFQCDLCEMKFKFKYQLSRHMKVHLKRKQIQDGLDLREKRYHCGNCDYKSDDHRILNRHKLIHLKPEEIQYFYCYHCSNKFKRKDYLKSHIFRGHFKNVKQEKRYGCNKCDYETYNRAHLKRHNLVHLKPEETQYFYCYHCSYRANQKGLLKRHIFIHFKKGQVKFDCYICNFMTQKRESIIKHMKKHSKVQNKSEINEGN